MLKSIKNFIEKHIVSNHDDHHDPLCFDCNDGNDECKKYPECNHILNYEIKLKQIREEV